MEASGIKQVAIIGSGAMGQGIAINFAQAGLPVRLVDQNQEDPGTSPPADRPEPGGPFRVRPAGGESFRDYCPDGEIYPSGDGRSGPRLPIRNRMYPRGPAAQERALCSPGRPSPGSHFEHQHQQLQSLHHHGRDGKRRPGDRYSFFHAGPYRAAGGNPLGAEHAAGGHPGHPRNPAPRSGKSRSWSGRKFQVSSSIASRQLSPGRRNYLLEEGVVTPEDFDTAARASYGFRLANLGPLAQADVNGLDTVVRGNQVIYKSLCNADQPNQSLVAKVERGELGLEIGEGLLRLHRQIQGQDYGGDREKPAEAAHPLQAARRHSVQVNSRTLRLKEYGSGKAPGETNLKLTKLASIQRFFREE